MDDLITLSEAADRAGVSFMTLRRIIKENDITVYKNPRDARVRLVKAGDIDAVLEPTPMNSSRTSDQTPT